MVLEGTSRGQVRPHFIIVKFIRKNFIVIYGLLMFGLNILIAIMSPFFESITLNIIQIILWPLAGLIWGTFMWSINGSGFEKYIN
jgi:hypothetical protein